MNLTKNFTLQELTATNTGINNIPSNLIIENLFKLATTLEKVRVLFDGKPIDISSAYRSPDVNQKVGGSKTSAHMKGFAADFKVRGLSLKQVFDTIKSSGIEYDQLIIEPNWIHLGLSDGVMRKQNLTFDGKNYAAA